MYDQPLLYPDMEKAVYQPVVAEALDSEVQAVLLQQIHYWLYCKRARKDKKGFVGGVYWVYNTYGQWQEILPSLSTRTIQRAMLALEERGLIISGDFNKKRTDRTKWYTINYHKLTEIMQPILNGHKDEQEQDGVQIPDVMSMPEEEPSAPVDNSPANATNVPSNVTFLPIERAKMSPSVPIVSPQESQPLEESECTGDAPVQKIIGLWNEYVQGTPLPPARYNDRETISAIRSMWAYHPQFACFYSAISRVAKSKFWGMQDGRKRVPTTLRCVMQKEVFTRLVLGEYR